jgi:hypothetical protein
MSSAAGGGRRTGARPTDGGSSGGGIRVHGVADTTDNLHLTATTAVYTTAFINLRHALMVLDRSLDYVPWKTGELFESGVIGSVEGDFTSESDPFRGLGSVDKFDTPGHMAVAGSVSFKVGAVTRTFSRYYIGFTAAHAAIIHETEANYNQNTGKRPHKGPKGSHYLLRAYQELEHRFSAAHHAALAYVVELAGMRAAKAPTALSAGGGRPRLIRPGGR